MNAAFRKEHREITELLSVIVCRDHRRDADKHRARMLRDVALRTAKLADQLDPSAAQKVPLAALFDAFNRRACRVCRCTHTSPCYNPRTGATCFWVAPDLCSACALKPAKKRRAS